MGTPKKNNCMWFHLETKDLWECILQYQYIDYVHNDPHYKGKGDTPEKAFKDLIKNVRNNIWCNHPLDLIKSQRIKAEIHEKLLKKVKEKDFCSYENFKNLYMAIKSEVEQKHISK